MSVTIDAAHVRLGTHRAHKSFTEPDTSGFTESLILLNEDRP